MLAEEERITETNQRENRDEGRERKGKEQKIATRKSLKETD